MSPGKLAVACALSAITLTACGNTTKPVAGTPAAAVHDAGRGRIDDPRQKHIKCLQQGGLSVTKIGTTQLQIGQPPSGPSVTFETTPGAAQYKQFSGQVQGAEVIGSALLYPNAASDSELKTIEDCLAEGVTG